MLSDSIGPAADILATFRHYSSVALECGHMTRDAVREGKQSTKLEVAFWSDACQDNQFRARYRIYATAAFKGGCTAITAASTARRMILAESEFAGSLAPLTDSEDLLIAFAQSVKDQMIAAPDDEFVALKADALAEERKARGEVR